MEEKHSVEAYQVLHKEKQKLSINFSVELRPNFSSSF